MNIYSDAKQVSRRKRVFRIKFYFILFLFLLLMASIFYLIVYSPVLKIKSISVENVKFLTQDEIINILKPIILGGKLGGLAGFENMISWPNGEIIASNPIISSINIKKNWFKRTIEVEVNERQRFAIWCQQTQTIADSTQTNADKILQESALAPAPNFGAGVNPRESASCWWIDKQGVVFGEAPLTEGSLVSIVFDSRENSLPLGSKVEEERFVGNLISILENLNILDLEINRIDFDNELQELAVLTVDGPTIIFGLRYDSAKDIPLIKNLDYQKYKYIKLNVENRIYLCFQNDKCTLTP